uniref:Ramosa 2 n=1 Tax=Coix lacryma-jobi TaxID=4505 RepID=A0A4Y5P8A7_COILA|nr:ramosa 2 [Coix lacryma-jobi]
MASPSSTSNNSALSPVAAASTPGAGAPCAACKFLRRKCLPGCVFAPYFPPEEPQKFANVHKVFGASNVTKLLNELLPHQREDAVSSLAYEAEARVKDPVYGCVGAISVLQRQVHRLQKELDAAHAELLRYACGDIAAAGIPTALPVSVSVSAAAAPRLSTAMTTTSPGQQFAAAAGMMYGSRRLGVLDGGVAAPPPPPPPPPAGGCYFMRNYHSHNVVISSPPAGADVAPVLPYASVANWAVNAISASTTTTSGSESIGLDHKEGGDSSM